MPKGGDLGVDQRRLDTHLLTCVLTCQLQRLITFRIAFQRREAKKYRLRLGRHQQRVSKHQNDLPFSFSSDSP